MSLSPMQKLTDLFKLNPFILLILFKFQFTWQLIDLSLPHKFKTLSIWVSGTSDRMNRKYIEEMEALLCENHFHLIGNSDCLYI